MNQTKEEIEKRKELIHNLWCYSVQRIDILIITVSGAGVYVILESLKFSKTNPLSNIWTLKASGVALIVAIIINIISQITGKKSNTYDINMYSAMLSIRPWTSEQIDKIKCLDAKSEKYSNITAYMNSASIAAMFIGLTVIATT